MEEKQSRKLEGYSTINEVEAEKIKSRSWLWAAVKLEVIRSVKVGTLILIPDYEVDRLRHNPPKISREDYLEACSPNGNWRGGSWRKVNREKGK